MARMKFLILLLITHTQFLIPKSPPVDNPSRDYLDSWNNELTVFEHNWKDELKEPEYTAADGMPRCHNIHSGVIGEEKVECDFMIPRTMEAVTHLAKHLASKPFAISHTQRALANRDRTVVPHSRYQRFTTNPYAGTLTAHIRFNPNDLAELRAELDRTAVILADYKHQLTAAQLKAEGRKAFWRAMPLVSDDTVTNKKDDADQEYRFKMMKHPLSRDAFNEEEYKKPVRDDLIPEQNDNHRTVFEVMKDRVYLAVAYYGIRPIDLANSIEQYASKKQVYD